MLHKGEKIKNTLGGHRIKQHVFEPSKRIVWTVVGLEREYWLYPEQRFCSCPGYYFGKNQCYHLEALEYARRTGQVETVRFADDEYAAFISGLLAEL